MIILYYRIPNIHYKDADDGEGSHAWVKAATDERWGARMARTGRHLRPCGHASPTKMDMIMLVDM